MSRFRIVVEPLRDIATARAVWQELEPRSAASFFTSWTWLGTWLAATAIEPLMVTAHDGTERVAAGLFGIDRAGRALLHETGIPTWDRLTVEYNDLLVASDLADDPRPDCLAALAGRAALREIALSGVDARWLAAAAARRLPARLAHRRPTFAIPLDALSTDEALLDRLGPNTRAAIRQSMRRLGPIEGRPAASLADAHADLDRLIALHQTAWQARGQPGAFADPCIRAFHHQLLDQGWADGQVELFVVAGSAGPFAYLLNFRHRDVVHAYQSGLAGDLGARLKPGLVAHHLCAAHHAARGRKLYDLMAGDARYKRSLAPATGELAWIHAYGSRSIAAVAGLRRLGRRVANRLRRPG